MSVHRKDCKNFVEAQHKKPERIVYVDWDQTETKQRAYTCVIRVEGYDREGLLQDLLRLIYDANINLREVTTKVNKDNTRMYANFSVDLRDIKQFYELKQKLSIPDVYSILEYQ